MKINFILSKYLAYELLETPEQFINHKSFSSLTETVFYELTHQFFTEDEKDKRQAHLGTIHF